MKCSNCGAEMRWDGNVCFSNPPKFAHKCVRCGTVEYADSPDDLKYEYTIKQNDGKEGIIIPVSIDWPSFRREAAKDILCALVGNKDYLKVIGRIEPETMLAVRYADELIRQLKEE